MKKRLVDLGLAVAVIEPATNGQPFVTLFREDEGQAKSFQLDCEPEQMEAFAFALEAAVAEYKAESGS